MLNQKILGHSYYNGLVLTQSGKVYSVGTDFSYNQLPLKNVTNLNLETAYLCEWFEEKNIKIRSIVCTSVNNYFVSMDNVLYGNGFNSSFQLGKRTEPSNQHLPIQIYENVSNVYGSPHSNHNLFTTLDNKLIGLGTNSNAQLGLGHNAGITKPSVVPNIKASEIKQISCPNTSSIILFKNGKLFSCGKSSTNGQNIEKKTFCPIPSLKDKLFSDLASGYNHTIVLTTENELYGWSQQKDCFLMKNTLYTPVEIKTSFLKKNLRYELTCSNYNSFIFPPNPHKNSLTDNSEFMILFETGKFSDYTLQSSNIKIHKSFVECRIGTTIDNIEQVFNKYNKNEINTFLKWVYSGIVIEGYEILDKISKEFGIQNIFSIDFDQNLLNLYNDHDSKNFHLLVPIDDEYENEEEEEEEFEEIPVHKYILYAKSGLFREMFDNINESSNTVKDYSGKTIESLELLVKFFYTRKIELTADDDPELVVEELSDAVEYYQLNEICNLNNKLNSLKK
ncbi:btk-binding protein-related [Anaeramoeba flamelloides]|uniref:Btk-binding protein-related n=1 Tax=Anaeramoeba flamelloides TaxID=1746091 RepID=A0ABQ8Y0E3_9EUKA|nr:btk-binding protein-related [Anaeramoeba flamelloides]